MQNKFPKIIENENDWPIVKITSNRENFLEAIRSEVLNKLMCKYAEKNDLRKVTEKIIESEINLLSANKSENKKKLNFWQDCSLLISQTDNDNLEKVIDIITLHYLSEINGNFCTNHYKLGVTATAYTLCRLLNPISIPYFSGLNDTETNLENRLFIEGDVEKIRSLSKIGTVVLLPTHFSNLDSAIIFWACQKIGLPPFMYGAGINLFTKKFWNYTLSKVGTYKIDRNKKNPFYLTVLITYSSELIKFGCHSLFYPHGTRSRSGSIEEDIKMGLLSSVLTAQKQIYEKQGLQGKKVFLIPITLNTPFVLEAPIFAHNCLCKILEIDVNECTDIDHKDSFDVYEQLLKATNLVTKSSKISLRFGKPMDVMGNYVNDLGKSFNTSGNMVSLYEEIQSDTNKFYKSEAHLKQLGSKIIAEQKKSTTILNCQIIAYAIRYEYFKNHIENKNINDIKKAEITIEAQIILKHFIAIRRAAFDIKEAGLGFFESSLKEEDVPSLMYKASKELGSYHLKQPLAIDSNGNFIVNDLSLVVYYSNRIIHYRDFFDRNLETQQ